MSLTLPAASAHATEVDYLFAALFAVSAAVLGLVFFLMIEFSIRFRRNSGVDRGQPLRRSWRFETAWTAATLVGFLGLGIWGADLYVRELKAKPGALTIDVVAKQWMWKVEHPEGQREINELHIPVNRPVQLRMTSEDVIHDFGLPAFRLKHDVLPGRYETLSFTPDRIGTYQLYCNQFCGIDHANMIGTVTVLSQPDYERWLAANGAAETLAAQGSRLFVSYGCSGCHRAGGHGGEGNVRAPPLDGVYGSPVPLSDGTTIIADDQYLQDSILMPKKQIVASYDPVMPSFAGVIGEEDIVKLVEFIKSLGGKS
ncbi:MAG: cytochrome c oxidase subunit II [Acetobacteraceae bacterium]|nr:cytochrome c oxidase subunit II [Acetobacteraceae bacterium]